MFFACYSPNTDIGVVDKHLKELRVKFNDSKSTKDNSSRKCIDGVDIDGTRDNHLTEEISIIIPIGFEDLFI